MAELSHQEAVDLARAAADQLQRAADAAQAYADAAAIAPHNPTAGAIDPFVFRFSIFALAIFAGYYLVWSVMPACVLIWFNGLTSLAIFFSFLRGAVWRVWQRTGAEISSAWAEWRPPA